MNELKKMQSIIQLERITLRTFNLDDASNLFEYCSDKENIKWISIKPHEKLEDSINSIKNYFLNPHYGKYAIFLKEENKVIGSIDIKVRDEKEYYIGYILNKKYHKNGYAKEALKGLIISCFTFTNINEIIFEVDIENEESNNLAKSFCSKKIIQEKEFNIKFNEERTFNIYTVNKKIRFN